ncbi:Helicase associated domain protein [Streptomonospora nanhaiensis]|uniref:DEAD/DEAH box helicase n=1 Tax=Streptomonospora nanhaiensis TaxID=1323731 RepID=UPI001C9919E8|nr:DEAD/DEAH box helicase [Streptomonospora nanhaiensis]MBX9390610.1 Helicase associated domain protein [Streptomonospora nanhaiensis]
MAGRAAPPGPSPSTPADPHLRAPHFFLTMPEQLPLPLSTGTRPEPGRVSLRPHQVEALEAAAKRLARESRVHDVLACGTGKTMIGGALAEALAPRGRVLMLMPRIHLIAQAIADYRLLLPDAALGRILIVCSEHRITADPRLRGLDVDVTTDPAQIAQAAKGPGRITVLSTYHSAATAIVQAHARHGLAPWDLVQADEAHHLVGVGTWTRLHSDDHLPARRRRYTTATARILTDRHGDTHVASMDDIDVFGVCSYQLGFAEAIHERELLCPWRLVVPVVTDAEVERLWDSSQHLSVGPTAVSADVLASQIAVLKAMHEFGGGRGLTFHPRVADARAWAAVLPHAAALLDAGPPVQARHLNGTHSSPHRARTLDWFASPRTREQEVRLLTNVRLFREGYDAPGCDTVVLTHAGGSVIDLVQTLSRALRRDPHDPGKTATFIAPVRVRGEVEESLQDQGWGTLWQALRALGSMDARIHDAAGAALRARGAAQGSELSPQAPQWLHVRGVPVPPRFAEAIGVAVMRTLAPPVEEYLGAAEEFRRQHGHLMIPKGYVTASQLHLGTWLKRMRKRKAADLLDSWIIDRLDAIDVVWDPLRAQRDELYAYTARYVAEHGNADVRRRYVTKDGYSLGSRLYNLRKADREGRVSAQERAPFEQLGVVFARRKRWRAPDLLAAAQRFHRQHGHLRVGYNFVDEQGCPLGRGLGQVRELRRKGKLSAEVIAAWDQVGMDWDPLATKRRLVVRGVQQFKQRYGHTDIPSNHVTADGFRLGTYLENARQRSKRGGNPQARQALAELGVHLAPYSPSSDTSHGDRADDDQS